MLKKQIRSLGTDHPLEIILLLIFIFFSLSAPGFFTVPNLLNILRNISTQGIIALGMTMIIISGEIDLSVGSMVAWSGCLMAWLVRLLESSLGINVAVVLALIITLSNGILIGLFIGNLRKIFKVPSFIITLSLLTILFGAASLLTGGFPIAPFPQWYSFLGSGYLGGFFPLPAVIFILAILLLHFIMKYTVLGRSVYAVGGNSKSARVSGINIWRIKTWTFVITSFFAALSGILVSSQIMSGNPGTARGWELEVIASVIIGGTSLFGGKGKIWGTTVGVVFLGIIINGMTLLNIDEYWQYVVRGALILGAVLLNYLQSGEMRKQDA